METTAHLHPASEPMSLAKLLGALAPALKEPSHVRLLPTGQSPARLRLPTAGSQCRLVALRQIGGGCRCRA